MANISKYLGIKMKRSAPPSKPSAFKTNKDKLITTAVQAVVHPAGSSGYRPTFDGRTSVRLGSASINYSVSLGDSTYGWANADHVEPDVTIQGRDKESPSECAIAILACIGNEAKVLSGEAKGAKGIYIGRHAGSDDLAWFPKDIKEKLTLNDEIQVKAKGVGLKIEGFEDVRVNKLSPELLENIGLRIEDDQLVVPVVMEVPGRIMGSGIGGQGIEYIDYDIQTTDPKTVEEFGLKKLRLTVQGIAEVFADLARFAASQAIRRVRAAVESCPNLLGIFVGHKHFCSEDPLGATWQFMIGLASDGHWRIVKIANTPPAEHLEGPGEIVAE